MADATTISVLIKARDQASAAFRNVEDNAGKMAQGIARNRRAIGVGMLGIGAAITGVGVVMAKTAAGFDAKMREVNSLIGLSQGEFQKLTEETLEMSSAIGVDAVKASEALYQAISAGVPRENVIDFMTVASKAAIAGVTDTETAVDGLTTVMNAFKMDVSEAQRVADIMFVAVKGGKTTFEELSASMFYVAPIAAALGVEFEAIGAAAATMTKQGMPTKQAFTALRQTFIALMKPTVEMEGALDQVGFASGRALLNAHGLQAGLQLLVTGTNLTEAQMTKAFGSAEAFGAALMLTGENAEEAAADLVKSYDHMGASTEAFDIINASTARQLERMQARLKVVSIELGTVLLPIVIAITGKVSDLASKFRDFYRDHPTLVKWVGLISLGLAGLLVVFGGILLILPGLVAGFGLLSVAMGPITIALVGIATAVTAAIYIWKKWDDAGTKMKAVLLGLAIGLAAVLGPIGWITLAVTAGIKIWQNWDTVVSKVKKLLADTGKGFIWLARQILVTAKAIADFIPGLKGTEDALQADIDMLDRMSASMDDWSNETARKTREAADAWGMMEDSHHSTSGVVKAQNDMMGQSTIDTAEIVERAMADSGVALQGFKADTEEVAMAAELGWGAVEDAVLQAQGVTIKSLDEIIKAQEDLESSLDSNLARIRSNMDATNIQWKESGKGMENVVQAWADIMDMEIEDVLARMDELNVDTNNVKATLNTFADETGRNFFTWADNVDAATKQAALSLKNTEATLQTQMDKYQDILIGGFNVKQLDLLGWSTNEINNAMDAQVKALEEAEQRLADRMSNIGERTEGREAGSIQRNIHALGVGTGQTTVLGAFQAIQASGKFGSPDHRTMIKGMEQEDILDAILESAGAEAALGSHEKIRAAGLADLFGLDKKQRGGLSRGGMTLVGEGGPEIVSLPGGSFVHPNGSGPGGVTNNFHFHGAVYGVEDLKDAVVEAVRDHAISGGFSGVFAEA